MREHEIRRALLDELASLHVDDTLILEELGLDQGAVRVDVAVVNGLLSGFEIKSDWDNLERLPAQRDVYNAVFDEVTVVAGRRHLNRVLPLVPDWWGIIIAEQTGDGLPLRMERPAAQNPTRNSEMLARLLWRDEAVAVLTRHGVTGMSSASRRVLWARLAAELSVDELSLEVRLALKGRSGWSTARPRS